MKCALATPQAYENKYSLPHRKCGLRGCVHELFVWKPEREGTREWGLLTQTTSEYIKARTKQFLRRELFITRNTRIFIEIVFLTKIKNQNSRTWTRKLAINTSTSLAPIISISLSSFLETKIFLSNETSFCDLIDVFLSSWCHTNTSEQQPTDTNLDLSSAFAGKFERGADKRAAAKSEKLFECEGCTMLIG